MSFTRREFLRRAGLGTAALSVSACPAPGDPTPNILVAVSDDQSWAHTSIAGDPVVRTPNFDRVAREGIHFTHAFVTSPSCTASRSSLLTGQDFWRLEAAGVLYGTLPVKYPIYPRLLEQHGYHVGFTGNGWGPGELGKGWRGDPLGTPYEVRIPPERVLPWMSPVDYAASFEAFLADRQPGQPFCFWYGSSEPHRPYALATGAISGLRMEDVHVPPFLPDVAEVRSDLLGYYFEIEWFDQQLGAILGLLDPEELDRTLVVVTSDNGMPFPRAKTNLYDYGVRVPLAIRWASEAPGGRSVDDFVSLTDLAPTFLEAAGVPVPDEMTGRSLMPLLRSNASGRTDPARDRAVTGIEKHAALFARRDFSGYPSRAIRTERWLYIRNYEPDRWPAGDPPPFSRTFAPQSLRRVGPPSYYAELDPSPTKDFLLDHRDEPEVAGLFPLIFGKRPEEELYDVQADPGQIHNRAGDPELTDVERSLRERLERHLVETKDPRSQGLSPWDDYGQGKGSSRRGKRP